MKLESGSRVRVPESDNPGKIVRVGYIEDEDEFPVKLCEPVSFGGSRLEALRVYDVVLVNDSRR